jgi:hypothetical protein
MNAFAVLLLLSPPALLAQQEPFSLPYEYPAYLRHEYNIRQNGGFGKHTAVKPLMLYDAYAEQQEGDTSGKSRSWLYRKVYLEHLFDLQGKAYSMQIDPLFDFALGYETKEPAATWQNTRGLRIRGNIGSKLAFSSELYENQSLTPAFLDTFIFAHQIKPVVPGVGIIPGQGIVRPFGDGRGWDYSNATAYLTYSPVSFVNLQFGHGKHFIGHGYRSVLLSDAAYPYPFFRLQATFGPLQYTWWLMQHSDPGEQPLSYYLSFRKKYASMGYLNWQVSPKFELGILQALVWAGDDSIGGPQPPAWQYMNPLVFLHPVHYGNGSEGNLFIGLNMKWNLSPRHLLYGQLMFDEIKVNELISQSGSAANKYAAQAGIKWFGPWGTKGLVLQTEFNMARPYTFSHIRRLSAYGHYLQPLGHPSGANFIEGLALARYHFGKHWYASGKIVWIRTGVDTDSLNYGSNIFRNYLEPPGGEGVTGIRLGQGAESITLHTEFLVGYLLNRKTNMKIEARYIQRSQGIASDRLLTQWFSVGVSTSLRNLYYDF